MDSRSISTNLLAFENHISQDNYCILALQSLSVEKRNLPRMNYYYYPPLYNNNKKTNKVQTTIYIHSDLGYTIPILIPVTNVMQEVCATTAMVKLTNRQHSMLSLCTFKWTKRWQQTLAKRHCTVKQDYKFIYIYVIDSKISTPMHIFGEMDVHQ